MVPHQPSRYVAPSCIKNVDGWMRSRCGHGDGNYHVDTGSMVVDPDTWNAAGGKSSGYGGHRRTIPERLHRNRVFRESGPRYRHEFFGTGDDGLSLADAVESRTRYEHDEAPALAGEMSKNAVQNPNRGMGERH